MPSRDTARIERYAAGAVDRARAKLADIEAARQKAIASDVTNVGDPTYKRQWPAHATPGHPTPATGPTDTIPEDLARMARARIAGARAIADRPPRPGTSEEVTAAWQRLAENCVLDAEDVKALKEYPAPGGYETAMAEAAARYRRTMAGMDPTPTPVGTVVRRRRKL